MQSNLKCMKSVIPTAKNGIFSEINQGGEIKFDKIESDQPRPDNEHGHVSTGSGDSGSPYWIEDENGAATLIAVNHGNIANKQENKAWYSNDPYWQCRTIATKITNTFIRWMEEKEIQEIITKE